jgi:hypothetical protein
MTPSEMLAAARQLIERPDAATAGVWPRTAALLARQALELALDSHWVARPGTARLASCTMRSQLTCLPFCLGVGDEGVASQIAYTWAALSCACHFHPYELAPTAAELIGWIDDVGRLIMQIASR